jgi:predicted RND superfamily exporter protein
MNSTTFYTHLDTFRTTQSPQDDPFGNWKDEIGFIDGALKYVMFTFKATLPFVSSSADKGEVIDRMDSFVNGIKRSSDCDNDCSCTVYHTSMFLWNWYNTEQGLVFGFYQGMSISFPMAFLVLIFATGNVQLALYAITSIFFIVFGVLGFVYSSLGWDLGVAESVAGIIIIGFSVDYTVHLGNEYIVGGKEGFAKRTERFFYASRRIVSTVAAGAMTTGGAGIFMFPAQLIFFVKMATLMVATIVLSYLYALGFFMGYLLVFGPEDEDGNVSTYVNKTKDLVEEARAVLGVARDKESEAGAKEVKELELATVVV